MVSTCSTCRPSLVRISSGRFCRGTAKRAISDSIEWITRRTGLDHANLGSVRARRLPREVRKCRGLRLEETHDGKVSFFARRC